MTKGWIMGILFGAALQASAQPAEADIAKGNEAYRKQDYPKAEGHYRHALERLPSNPVARFNLGNALLKQDKAEEALAQFEASANAGRSKVEKADALYNRGVVLTRQGKLGESIDAYKTALRLNPADTLARQNLQRALNEKKKQQEEEQKKNGEQQPRRQQDKMNRQQVMQMLNALQEQEKQLQRKIQNNRVPSPTRPDKDW
jgi:Ca-activated chloride channel family protein